MYIIYIIYYYLLKYYYNNYKYIFRLFVCSLFVWIISIIKCDELYFCANVSIDVYYIY